MVTLSAWQTRVLSRMPLLRLLPEEVTLTLFQPPLGGLRWVNGAGVHAFWMGAYEPQQVRALAEAIQPGMVVADVGAHAGFYTLLAARLVGEAGRVYAFEPLPRNVAYLRRHVALNGLSNVTVIPAAVSDRAGQGAFQVARSSTMGRLDAAGTLSVPVLTLDGWLAETGSPPPDVVKLDVEGGEVAALHGMAALLAAYHPLLALSTHGSALHTACRDLLCGQGYAVREMVARTGARPGVPDGLLAHFEGSVSA